MKGKIEIDAIADRNNYHRVLNLQGFRNTDYIGNRKCRSHSFDILILQTVWKGKTEHIEIRYAQLLFQNSSIFYERFFVHFLAHF